MDEQNSKSPPMPLGTLPAWGHDELPAPLPFSTRNLFRTIGPGAILLATSIGAGEAPALAAAAARLAQVGAAVTKPVLCNWFSTVEQPPSLDEFKQLGVRVALYPVMAAQAGLQGAWELMHDFKARGPAALAEWRKRSTASPYGAADYKAFTGHVDVRRIETAYLPADVQRDYGGG